MKIKDKRLYLDEISGENYTRSSLSPRFWDTLIITIALALPGWQWSPLLITKSCFEEMGVRGGRAVSHDAPSPAFPLKPNSNFFLSYHTIIAIFHCQYEEGPYKEKASCVVFICLLPFFVCLSEVVPDGLNSTELYSTQLSSLKLSSTGFSWVQLSWSKVKSTYKLMWQTQPDRRRQEGWF